MKLVEMAFKLDIPKLKNNCILFIVDHLLEVSKADLSALPVQLLLEIIQHPDAVICDGDAQENEKQLFSLIWNKIKFFSSEEKIKLIPRVPAAVHLPVTDKYFLFFLLRQFEHIPEAKELIMKAGELTNPSEGREWYLTRYKDEAKVQIWKQDKLIEINGKATDEFSDCVLIKGFPFFIYATCPDEKKNERKYYVESPIAIEHLGLPYKVTVLLKLESCSRFVTVNTYRNRIVERLFFRKSGNSMIHVKVQFS